MGLFSRKRSEATTASFVPVEGEQVFVGEKSYQVDLAALLEGRGYSPESLENHSEAVSESFVARLVPEPSNPYDSNAVAVHVDGRKVAYLSRRNAVLYCNASCGQAGEMRVVLWVKARGLGIVSVWPDDA